MIQTCVIALGVMAVATFLTRVLPFVALSKFKHHPTLLFIGKNLPGAAMLLLVMYALKGTEFNEVPYGLHELLSVGVVIGLHVWQRNSLLSIGVGTACYVYLIQSQWLVRIWTSCM